MTDFDAWKKQLDQMVEFAAALLDASEEEVLELPTAVVVDYLRAYTAFVNLHRALGGAVFNKRAVHRLMTTGEFRGNAREFLIKPN